MTSHSAETLATISSPSPMTASTANARGLRVSATAWKNAATPSGSVRGSRYATPASDALTFGQHWQPERPTAARPGRQVGDDGRHAQTVEDREHPVVRPRATLRLAKRHSSG